MLTIRIIASARVFVLAGCAILAAVTVVTASRVILTMVFLVLMLTIRIVASARVLVRILLVIRRLIYSFHCDGLVFVCDVSMGSNEAFIHCYNTFIQIFKCHILRTVFDTDRSEDECHRHFSILCFRYECGFCGIYNTTVCSVCILKVDFTFQSIFATGYEVLILDDVFKGHIINLQLACAVFLGVGCALIITELNSLDEVCLALFACSGKNGVKSDKRYGLSCVFQIFMGSQLNAVLAFNISADCFKRHNCLSAETVRVECECHIRCSAHCFGNESCFSRGNDFFGVFVIERSVYGICRARDKPLVINSIGENDLAACSQALHQIFRCESSGFDIRKSHRLCCISNIPMGCYKSCLCCLSTGIF